MDIRKLVLSKWLYYVLTALVLLVVYIELLPLALKGQEIDLAQNFLSEIWGMIFTLIVFVMFMDWRERLEWKSVEDRVRKRIGSQIHALFAHLSILCKVERVHFDPLSKEKRIKLVERQLNTLASEEIRFTMEAKKDLLDTDLRRSYESILDSKLNSLGRIEERYSKFLGSEVRASLMDIQDYLDELSLEFRIRHIRDEDYFKSLSDLIGKTMKEIQRLKRLGFWVNW